MLWLRNLPPERFSALVFGVMALMLGVALVACAVATRSSSTHTFGDLVTGVTRGALYVSAIISFLFANGQLSKAISDGES